VQGLLCGTVVECWSLAGKLSLSCARPAADWWPLVWVNRPLQVSQLDQLTLSPFEVDKWVVSSNWMSTTLLAVAPSGECLQGEGLVWLIGAVVCLLAAATVPIVRYGEQWIATFVLQHHCRPIARGVRPVGWPPKSGQVCFLWSTFLSVGEWFH